MFAISLLASLALLQRTRKPIQTLVEAVTGGGTSRLDELERGRMLVVCSITYVGRIKKLSKLTHWRCRMLWRPSLSVISAAFMAF